MRLVPASMHPPPGLRELLTDLADGENGFTGTPVARGEMTLEAYLHACCDMPDPTKLKPGLVPQTVYWVLDDEGTAVGMVKLRHYLNDRLRIHGGHVGYFIRRDRRGKGYGTQALRLALAELRRLGQTRALITVDPGNTPSIRVVEANGGRFEDAITDPRTGRPVKRGWIDLTPQPPTPCTD